MPSREQYTEYFRDEIAEAVLEADYDEIKKSIFDYYILETTPEKLVGLIDSLFDKHAEKGYEGYLSDRGCEI